MSWEIYKLICVQQSTLPMSDLCGLSLDWRFSVYVFCLEDASGREALGMSCHRESSSYSGSSDSINSIARNEPAESGELIHPVVIDGRARSFRRNM